MKWLLDIQRPCNKNFGPGSHEVCMHYYRSLNKQNRVLGSIVVCLYRNYKSALALTEFSAQTSKAVEGLWGLKGARCDLLPM